MEDSRDAVSAADNPADNPAGEETGAAVAAGEAEAPEGMPDSDGLPTSPEADEAAPTATADGTADGTDAGTADDTAERLARIAESVLFAAGVPVSLRKLVEILDGPAAKDVLAALAKLKAEYGPGQRGIQLHEVAGGYQLRTARENAPWVRAVFKEKPARLGRAALETLAVVAYKQPVTRAEIEAIRGVDVDGVLNTLLARRLIKVAGRKETVGRPQVYGTTPDFLEIFGLKDINELPSLRELGPEPYADAPDPNSAADEAADPTRAADVFDAAFVADVDPDDPAGAPAAGEDDGAVEGEDDGTFAAGSAAEAAAAADPGPGTEAAEAAEPGGDCLTAEGGGADPRGEGARQRSHGDGTGDEGEPED